MLILTRRTGESILIGDQIIITALAIKGNQVRIGINAPKEVPVHREEMYNKHAPMKKNKKKFEKLYSTRSNHA